VKAGKGDFGYNAREDRFENMLAAGIIDPTKVTRLALENAASIAGLLLTTEAVVSDIQEEKAADMGHSHGGGGMGGMM
jgi:chaperonin GroEL